MALKTIEKWKKSYATDQDIVFENYLCGFNPIKLDKQTLFRILMVYITIDRRKPYEIKNIRVFPWDDGRIYVNFENLVPSSIKNEIEQIARNEFLQKDKEKVFFF